MRYELSLSPKFINMNKEEIRKQIEAEIDLVKEKISTYQDMTSPIAPENAIGRVSRMDAINNKGVAQAALQQAKLKLSQLQNALQQIDSDDFGKCARCQSLIPPMRIIKMPESPYCIRCARFYS